MTFLIVQGVFRFTFQSSRLSFVFSWEYFPFLTLFFDRIIPSNHSYVSVFFLKSWNFSHFFSEKLKLNMFKSVSIFNIRLFKPQFSHFFFSLLFVGDNFLHTFVCIGSSCDSDVTSWIPFKSPHSFDNISFFTHTFCLTFSLCFSAVFRSPSQSRGSSGVYFFLSFPFFDSFKILKIVLCDSRVTTFHGPFICRQ